MRELITLDADGVLLNYAEGYARAWELAFGERLQVQNPAAYHAPAYWGAPVLDKAGQQHLKLKGFTEEVWNSIPAMPHAVEACLALVQEGYRLECVTALAPQWEAARFSNLRQLGFAIERVHAVGHSERLSSVQTNPKLAVLKRLAPVAFVDDYLPYLQGLPPTIWRALIHKPSWDSPNTVLGLEVPHSTHESLAEFVSHWLSQKRILQS